VRERDQVNAGQPFLTVVDPSSMVLDATVNQVDAVDDPAYGYFFGHRARRFTVDFDVLF